MNGIIGVAGLVVTAVSAVVGAIESYNEKQRQARQESIQTALAQEEDIKTLTSLYIKYQTLDTTASEYLFYGNCYFHQREQADAECHARLYPLLRAGEENR